jgi:NAD(P)-dependent dehydrogenase (short-subunit alcohol dehydrogenase family)
VLLTGGSRGLGLALARAFAAQGARLALCARDAEELDAAHRDVEALGAEVMTLTCDVADHEAVGRMVEQVTARFGSIDVLVNDAGIIQVGPAEALSLEDLKAVMAVNFWGTVHATLAVLPHMRRGGRIVNITSIGGAVAVPHLLGYTAAKFAAVGFSTGLAAEMARHGVAVTTVVPGLMRTGSFLHAQVKGQRRAEATLFSLASSLPVLTLDAERAARRVVLACQRKEPFVTLGVPFKALRIAAALAPGLTVRALSLVARALPGPGQDRPGTSPEPAGKWRAGLALSPLTRLGDAAAADLNEAPR